MYLMVCLVDWIVFDFVKVGVNLISFYLEGFDYIDCMLLLICDYGCKVGFVFNLVMLLNYFDYVMDCFDFVLLMLVNFGFGG